MARKNLLTGLTPTPELPADNAPVEGGSARGQGGASRFGSTGSLGAIGAVSRSIAQLQAQSVIDLAAESIDESFITDRMEGAVEQHVMLVESIREHGQQVPILVRPHPDREGRFQIAYGRRRLKALRELGKPVRAVVKQLTDQQLVVAQGQENSARTDLSFIERAMFAHKLEDGGFDRETIMSALSVDKGNLSRLIKVAKEIPNDIIAAIGAAPKAGRDRWIQLATRFENGAAITRARNAVLTFGTKDTDSRFEDVFQAAGIKRAKPPRLELLRAADGTRLGQIREDAKGVTLAIDKKSAGDFGAYLRAQLPELFAAFKRSEDARNATGKDH